MRQKNFFNELSLNKQQKNLENNLQKHVEQKTTSAQHKQPHSHQWLGLVKILLKIKPRRYGWQTMMTYPKTRLFLNKKSKYQNKQIKLISS